MLNLIKDSKIVTETGVIQGDILFSEQILAIGKDLHHADAKVYTADLVLPGGVDIHTHMTLDVGTTKVVDDFQSGGRAAIQGGTTTLVDHVGFAPENSPLSTSPHEYIRKNRQNTAIDFGIHGVFQHFHQNSLSQLRSLAEEGIRSFKIYLTYDYRLEDSAIVEILALCKELGVLPIFHAENHEILQKTRENLLSQGKISPSYHGISRPVVAESLAISHLISLAKKAGNAPLLIAHLSSEEGLQAIIQGKMDGNPHIYAETCPQYLCFTEKVYENPQEALKFIMSPPLRSQADQEALWWGISQGHIQTLGTDHCSFHYLGAKQQGKDNFTLCPNGAPGVQERMAVFYQDGVASGRLNLEEYVSLTATNPAKLSGLYPQKGVLQVGSDGDILCLSQRETTEIDVNTLEGNSDYSLYQGKTVPKIEKVFQKGRLVGECGKVHNPQGTYLPRGKFQHC